MARVTRHRMLERFRVSDEGVVQGTDSEPQD
jgi:hypothetical protein